MSVCYITQDQVYQSNIYDDDLDLELTDYTGALNLEEDLNYIRTAIRRLHGGVSFTDVDGLVDKDNTGGGGAIGAELFKKVNKSGDVMTGYLTLHANPTDNLHAATKLYTDNSISTLKNYTDAELSALDTSVDTRINNLRNYTNELVENAVDGVVRVYGEQDIGGLKTFTEHVTIASSTPAGTANLLLQRGSLTLTDGGVTVTKGNVAMTSGNLSLSSGNLTLSSGNVSVGGNVSLTATSPLISAVTSSSTGTSRLILGKSAENDRLVMAYISGDSEEEIPDTAVMGLGTSGLGVGRKALTLTAMQDDFAGWVSQTTFHGDVAIQKNHPWLTLKSSTSGVNHQQQAAGLSIGESGRKGGAALHLTYVGDGYSYIGMGAVDPATNIPAHPAMRMFYTNKNVQFYGALSGITNITGTGTLTLEPNPNPNKRKITLTSSSGNIAATGTVTIGPDDKSRVTLSGGTVTTTSHIAAGGNLTAAGSATIAGTVRSDGGSVMVVRRGDRGLGTNTSNTADQVASTTRAGSMIGAFPGWNENALFINSYSGSGQQTSFRSLRLDGHAYLRYQPGKAPGTGDFSSDLRIATTKYVDDKVASSASSNSSINWTPTASTDNPRGLQRISGKPVKNISYSYIKGLDKKGILTLSATFDSGPDVSNNLNKTTLFDWIPTYSVTRIHDFSLHVVPLNYDNPGMIEHAEQSIVQMWRKDARTIRVRISGRPAHALKDHHNFRIEATMTVTFA